MQIYDSHNHVSMTRVFKIGVIGACIAGFSKLKGPKKTQVIQVTCHVLCCTECSDLKGPGLEEAPHQLPEANLMEIGYQPYGFTSSTCVFGGAIWVRHGHFGAYCFEGFDPPRSGPAKIQWGCRGHLGSRERFRGLQKKWPSHLAQTI
jgi:hypothetical protein